MTEIRTSVHDVDRVRVQRTIFDAGEPGVSGYESLKIDFFTRRGAAAAGPLISITAFGDEIALDLPPPKETTIEKVLTDLINLRT
ncbi:MAG: hypothetical protein KatS3mg051_1577 [Anaerolineae bacterium]|nr:MAG: hypothetical protein KatS3mg051_1577 [Anaerolineae bacterium]